MPASILAVQAALDHARRLGIRVTLPVQQWDGDPASAAASPASRVVDAGGSTFDELIHAAAAREGIDPSLVRAVAQAESGLDARAVSPAGAKGVMQLMDGTARALGVVDPFDAAQNIAGGARYLKQMLGRYGGDVRRALAAYNTGPGAVDRHGGVPPYAETQAYVQRVLRLADETGMSGPGRAAAPLASPLQQAASLRPSAASHRPPGVNR